MSHACELEIMSVPWGLPDFGYHLVDLWTASGGLSPRTWTAIDGLAGEGASVFGISGKGLGACDEVSELSPWSGAIRFAACLHRHDEGRVRC